jgi:hypothetical protein
MELLPKTRVELRLRVRLGTQAATELTTQPEQVEIPQQVLLAFAPLHRVALGVASGVVSGGMLFALTMILVVKGGYPLGPNLALMGEFLYGYTVSFTGAFVGLAWGLGLGYILGWGFAVAHNLATWLWLLVIRSQAEMEQYGDFLDHM